MNLLLCPYYVK